MAKSTARVAGQSIPEKMREKHDAVLALVDDCCRAHLNEEYNVLCRQLLGVLARKRPSPMINGTAAAWACGVVRAVGWVNFLDDKSEKPYMKATEIDKHFGVSTGTGQGRSKAIRDLLDMHPFDTDWTLPSRMDSNPMAWMIQINGIFADARYLPREIQEEAFDRGLIPYLPHDEDRKPQTR